MLFLLVKKIIGLLNFEIIKLVINNWNKCLYNLIYKLIKK